MLLFPSPIEDGIAPEMDLIVFGRERAALLDLKVIVQLHFMHGDLGSLRQLCLCERLDKRDVRLTTGKLRRRESFVKRLRCRSQHTGTDLRLPGDPNRRTGVRSLIRRDQKQTYVAAVNTDRDCTARRTVIKAVNIALVIFCLIIAVFQLYIFGLDADVAVSFRSVANGRQPCAGDVLHVGTMCVDRDIPADLAFDCA